MKNISPFGNCQLLYAPQHGSFHYYLSQNGYVVYIAKEGSGCNNGVFGDVEYFIEKHIQSYYADSGNFTAPGIKVMNNKVHEVLENILNKNKNVKEEKQ